MKSSSKFLVLLASSLGLCSINFAVSLPAKAAIVCEPGLISRYQNNSLATCILGEDTNVQVNTRSSGANNFQCKAKAFISFDDKGQFTGCQLSQEVKLVQGNSVQICPADYKVTVSVSTDGVQSISCSPY